MSYLESCPCGDKTAQVTVETGGGVEPGVGSGVAALNDVVDGSHAAESEPPAALRGPCWDRDGEFLTHMNTLRRCRWLNLDNVEERRALNCNATEMGLICLES